MATNIDASLAALLFTFLYAPSVLLGKHVLFSVDSRLQDAASHAKCRWMVHGHPVGALFKSADQQSVAEQHLYNRLERFFLGLSTAHLSKPLYALLALAPVGLLATTLYQSELWRSGQLPISDFRVMCVLAFGWLLLGAVMSGLQYWALTKVESGWPSFATDD